MSQRRRVDTPIMTAKFHFSIDRQSVSNRLSAGNIRTRFEIRLAANIELIVITESVKESQSYTNNLFLQLLTAESTFSGR